MLGNKGPKEGSWKIRENSLHSLKSGKLDTSKCQRGNVKPRWQESFWRAAPLPGTQFQSLQFRICWRAWGYFWSVGLATWRNTQSRGNNEKPEIIGHLCICPSSYLTQKNLRYSGCSDIVDATLLPHSKSHVTFDSGQLLHRTTKWNISEKHSPFCNFINVRTIQHSTWWFQSLCILLTFSGSLQSLEPPRQC